jgi:CheY-like chemotaxis protein
MDKVKIFFIVDDDIDDREFFMEALREIDPSINCIAAINGDEALQKLEGWIGPLPDFIILDLNLPGMHGKKCLVELKKSKTFNGIPVIIYSTTSEKKVIKEMEDLGAAYFISKPNRLPLLCDSLRYLLSVDWAKKNYVE